MKTIKVGINGFGRIGRAFLKVAWDRPEIEIVAVNDLGNIDNMAYLLKYDTVYRKWNHKIEVAGNDIIIDDKKVKVLAQKDPTMLPWKDLEVDVVVESTGLFVSYDKAKVHLDAGAKKVVITAMPYTIIKNDKSKENTSLSTVIFNFLFLSELYIITAIPVTKKPRVDNINGAPAIAPIPISSAFSSLENRIAIIGIIVSGSAVPIAANILPVTP